MRFWGKAWLACSRAAPGSQQPENSSPGPSRRAKGSSGPTELRCVCEGLPTDTPAPSTKAHRNPHLAPPHQHNTLKPPPGPSWDHNHPPHGMKTRMPCVTAALCLGVTIAGRRFQSNDMGGKRSRGAQDLQAVPPYPKHTAFAAQAAFRNTPAALGRRTTGQAPGPTCSFGKERASPPRG